MWFLLAGLACSFEAPVVAPVTPVPAPEAPARASPRGTIGGEPILDRPTVLGGIGTEAVERALASRADGIRRCWSDELREHPGLAGKILVKFAIRADGSVEGPVLRSTSLRHPVTEHCVLAQVAEVRFPPLRTGVRAIVHYPFTFR